MGQRAQSLQPQLSSWKAEDQPGELSAWWVSSPQYAAPVLSGGG